MRARSLSGYFIRVQAGRYFIVARYDDGTEEVRGECESAADAELQLTLATGSFEYEMKQLSLDL